VRSYAETRPEHQGFFFLKMFVANQADEYLSLPKSLDVVLQRNTCLKRAKPTAPSLLETYASALLLEGGLKTKD
jgi:hypothetical protein